MIKIKNISIGTVLSNPDRMYAWPGICRAANGDILVGASERLQHICPYGCEVIVRSSDGGQSWTLPQEIYNSELDDRDINLATLSDGTIILSWFTSNAFEEHWSGETPEVTEKMRNELLGTWFIQSHDSGLTWGKNKKSIPVGLHISPVELSDGSLVSIGIENRFKQKSNTTLNVYKTEDRGNHWHKTAEINSIIKNSNGDTVANLNENHILEIADGNLIALFRSERGGDTEGYLYQSFSNDYGSTWTKPKKTNIWGYPPHLLRLSNGIIMCSYSHRREPYSIRAVFSYDEGKSWDTDNITTLYEWEDEPDMGYPSSIELSPGKILTVFYCSRRDADYPDQTQRMDADSPEGILSATFSLENY